MKIKLIKTSEDYENAISMLEEIGDREDFQESEELIADFELLSDLICRYEKENYAVSEGHPIDIILLKMNYLGLKRKDLSHIASSGVLSEVFSKKRALSKKMIRQFSELLDIDQNLLNISYSVEGEVAIPAIKNMRSTFRFIKKEAANIERFKKTTRETGMIFNMACL